MTTKREIEAEKKKISKNRTANKRATKEDLKDLKKKNGWLLKNIEIYKSSEKTLQQKLQDLQRLTNEAMDVIDSASSRIDTEINKLSSICAQLDEVCETLGNYDYLLQYIPYYSEIKLALNVAIKTGETLKDYNTIVQEENVKIQRRLRNRRNA